jgi:biopolymer transport protein ExbB
LLGLLVETPGPLERLQQGGLVGYVILALGAFGLLLVAYRLFYLTWVGGRIRRQLRNLAEPSTNNPLGRILAVGNGSASNNPANLELQIDEAVLRETPRLTRGEGLIKLLTGIAPLLGLLGTVVGMMFGTGDPKLMANGISQALVTTAQGLIVAIPLLFLHTLVTSRSRALVQILEEQSAGLAAMRRELP